jgi:AcrR family transcriptional regulator
MPPERQAKAPLSELPEPRPDPRYNQRLRTRRAIVEAAMELIQAGNTPTVPEAADAALVSRATAYRYFPTQAALLAEAVLLPGLPSAEELFGRDDAPTDPADRIALVSDVMYEHISAREKEFRIFLGDQLVRALDTSNDAPRPGFRMPLIDAALLPLNRQLAPKSLERLKHALSVLIGTEAVVTCRDVLQLDHKTGRNDMSWACRAIVRGALEEAEAAREKRATRSRPPAT